MIDAAALTARKTAFDFLAAVPGLRRVAGTHGGEYHGPCPVCGGVDRFVAWPRPDEGPPRAWCRQCHPAPMDAPAFLQWRDGVAFPEAARRLGVRPAALTCVGTYDYLDAAGRLLYQVVRYAPKSFRGRQPRAGLTHPPRADVDTDWEWNLGGVERVLYRLPAVLGAAPDAWIWVCEGEKDADRLAALGVVATTNPHGAGKWRDAYTATLAGRKVLLVPDTDEAGARHRDLVLDALRPVCPRVKVVTLPAACKDVSDFLDAGHTLDDLAALAGPAPVAPDAPAPAVPIPDAPAPRFRVLDDAASDALPPPTWLVDEVVIAGAVNLLYGPGGSGKSVLAIDLACTLAAGGGTWYDRAAAAGPVVYIAAEAPDEVAQRKRAWKADRGVAALPGFYLVPERVPLLDATAVPGLVAALPPAAARPVLIVIDTLSRTMRGGDENDSRDMGVVFEAAERLRDATGATILIIHHSGKDASRGARGSSALTFDARQALSASLDDAVLTIGVEKHNNSATQEPLRFVLRTVPDPARPDASTVVLGRAAPGSYEAAAGPLAPTQRAVLDELAGAVFNGAATSAEGERVDDLRGRGVYRALKALIGRGYVRTPHPPKTPGRRFYVTPAGYAALGRPVPGLPAGLTVTDDDWPARPAALPASDTPLTVPSECPTDGAKPARRHGLTVTDGGLTVTDGMLDCPPSVTDATDGGSIEPSVASVTPVPGGGAVPAPPRSPWGVPPPGTVAPPHEPCSVCHEWHWAWLRTGGWATRCQMPPGTPPPPGDAARAGPDG